MGQRRGSARGLNAPPAPRRRCPRAKRSRWLDSRSKSRASPAALSAIALPVLAIRGDEDPYNTPIQLERIAALVKGPVTLEQLGECGHAPHAEQPVAVLELLRDFVMGADHDLLAT